jgi:DNA-binding response OmpR family regulator
MATASYHDATGDRTAGRRGGSPVILLLGDEPLTTQLVARILDDAGFRTDGAAHSGAARDRLVRAPAPALVIRDLPHDRQGDPELVDLVDRAGGCTPIVYLTGDALDDHCDAEGRAVIAKPFTPERLLSAVTGFLDGGGRRWRPAPETHVPQALLGRGPFPPHRPG